MFMFTNAEKSSFKARQKRRRGAEIPERLIQRNS